MEVGERRGEARYKVSFPKAQKQWVVKPIRAKKSYTHVFRLMDDVVSRCQSVGLSNECQITDEEPVNLPKNIATMPAPDKQELIHQHRSRFS